MFLTKPFYKSGLFHCGPLNLDLEMSKFYSVQEHFCVHDMTNSDLKDGDDCELNSGRRFEGEFREGTQKLTHLVVCRLRLKGNYSADKLGKDLSRI